MRRRSGKVDGDERLPGDQLHAGIGRDVSGADGKAAHMDVTDVLGPVLLCIVVIAAVAAVYFGVTALRDRSREKRGDQVDGIDHADHADRRR